MVESDLLDGGVIDLEAEASAPTGVLGQLMRSGTTVEIRNTIADINQP